MSACVRACARSRVGLRHKLALPSRSAPGRGGSEGKRGDREGASDIYMVSAYPLIKCLRVHRRHCAGRSMGANICERVKVNNGDGAR